MATTSLGVATADSGNTPNTSAAFTPAIGDLLIGIVAVSSSVEASPSFTSSIGGFTFSAVTSVVRPGLTDTFYLYVADALVSSASSQTVAWSGTDQGTGSNIGIIRVAGMGLTGLSAVKQFITDSGPSGNVPGGDFVSACLTGNPTITAIMNASDPTGITPPANWTSLIDVSYTLPTTGLNVATRDSGFTAQTINWTSSATSWACIMLELDATVTSSSPAGRMLLTGIG